MYKINTTGATPDNEFTNGDIASQIIPTRLDAAWLNAIQRELINLVEGGGLVPSESTFDQILQAVRNIASGNSYNNLAAMVTRVGRYVFNGGTNLPVIVMPTADISHSDPSYCGYAQLVKGNLLGSNITGCRWHVTALDTTHLRFQVRRLTSQPVTVGGADQWPASTLIYEQYLLPGDIDGSDFLSVTFPEVLFNSAHAYFFVLQNVEFQPITIVGYTNAGPFYGYNGLFFDLNDGNFDTAYDLSVGGAALELLHDDGTLSFVTASDAELREKIDKRVVTFNDLTTAVAPGASFGIDISSAGFTTPPTPFVQNKTGWKVEIDYDTPPIASAITLKRDSFGISGEVPQFDLLLVNND